METCIKILELSSALDNLNKYLIIIGLVLLVLTILFLLRNKIGMKTVAICSLIGITSLSVYLGLEYHSTSKIFHSTRPMYDLREFMEHQAIEPADFISDFEEIDKHMRQWYELAQQKNISLSELYQTYRKQVSQAQNKQEYFDVLQRYFSELKNNHTALCYQTYRAHAGAEWRGDSLYVLVSYLKNPMKSGDRILEIDGKDVLAWRDSMMHYVSASTDWTRSTATANFVFDSYTDTLRNYTLMRGDSLYHLTLPLHKDFRKLSEKMYQSDRRHHPFTSNEHSQGDSLNHCEGASLYSLWPWLVGWEVEKLKEISPTFKDKSEIVIDLATTAEDQVESALEMVRYFLKKPYVTIHQDTLLPHPQAYKGPLYVFVSRYTSAAAELFASILQESGSATLFGEETRGDFGCHIKTYCTSHGTLFTIGAGKPKWTTAGKQAEGEGLKPAICVRKSNDISLLKFVRKSHYKEIYEQ